MTQIVKSYHWKFSFTNASGETALSKQYNLDYEATEKEAVNHTTKFVRDNLIECYPVQWGY